MKRIQNLVKNNFKYMTIFLGTMLCVNMLVTINYEFKGIENYSNKDEGEIKSCSSVNDELLDKPCEQINNSDTDNFFKCLTLIIKCIIGFILGGIISEKKFIFIGEI